jgi:hypothetical protein
MMTTFAVATPHALILTVSHVHFSPTPLIAAAVKLPALLTPQNSCQWQNLVSMRRISSRAADAANFVVASAASSAAAADNPSYANVTKPQQLSPQPQSSNGFANLFSYARAIHANARFNRCYVSV